MSVNRDQFMHAVATVGTFAAGLEQAFLSQAMSKPLHGGHAANTDVLAAMAASKGVTGALDIIEGKKGFGNAMSVNPDWSKVTRGLGSDYHVNHMTFKAHGCCGHTFPSIDGALHLTQQHKLLPHDIKKTRSPLARPASTSSTTPRPKAYIRRNSACQYTVAHAVVYGSVRLNAFLPERMSDPLVREVMKKVVSLLSPTPLP